MRYCGNCGTQLIQPTKSAAPEATNVAVEQLGVLMGSDLFERFRRAGLESAGQRRNVTVLFADLSDYSSLAERIDTEDLYELVQKFIRLMIESVYKYEGMVDKIIGDGLMALFGAPIAHENNAERAVRAALEMQASISRLSDELKERLETSLQLHIGLHTGTVIVGNIGSNLLMDYTAIGDTVNLANRLEETAPAGTILVSDSVYRATRALFDYEPTSPLVLKGMRNAVRAYRLNGTKAQPGSVRGLDGLRAPLIGREMQLEQLVEAVQALVDRKFGRLVLVTGEAGIGKTRLTAELKNQTDPNQVSVLEGHSLAYRRSVSYWIFQDLLFGYLGVTLETPRTQIRERLIKKAYECLGGQAAELLPYLEHLLGVDHADATVAERLAYLEAGQLRQQIFLAVRDLLVAEARRRPLLFILEDLHWADEASLDLLAFLIDSVRRAPLMVYAISRPFKEGPLGAITAHAQKWLPDWFIEIELRNLSLDQSERLLFELLAMPELPVDLRQQILQRAAGIPFYMEEILRMLIDGKVIEQQDGHWRLVPGAKVDALGVPDSLQGLILARFDRLEPVQRRILQSAAVIGRQFSLPLLSAVLQTSDQAQLRQILAQLVDKAFLLPKEEKQETEYLFRHVLTSDAVYSTLLRRDRDDLHGKVGEAIERLYAGRLDSQIEVLASHFMRSPQLDRALHYLILAGQKAARDYANQQARQHYQEAATLLSQVIHTTEQAIQSYEGLGDVLVFTGDYPAARAQYQAALQALEAGIPGRFVKESSVLLRKIGTTFERQGDYDQALLFLAEANHSLGGNPAPQPVEKAQILNDIGWIHFLRGSFDEARKFISIALQLVEATRKYDVVASIQNRLGAVAYQQREYDQAAAHVRKSLALWETIGDMAGVARLYNNLGLLGLMRGDLSDAEKNFKQSIELLERVGDAEGIALAHVNLGLVQLDRGDLKAAEGNLLKAAAAAEQIGHRFYLGLAWMYLGRLRTAQRQSSQAEQLLQDSLHIFEELGAQDNLIDAVYYLGENCFTQGDLSCALEWIRKAYEVMGDVTGDERAGSVQRGRVLRLHGAIARVSGEMDQAARMLQESLEIFNASYERLESARTVFEWGLMASVKKNYLEARQHFQEARLIFRQLGAEVDLQRIEEALLQFH